MKDANFDNFDTEIEERIEIIPSTEWMEEGLITLRKVKRHASSEDQRLNLSLFVFKNFVIPSFDAISIAGKVTQGEAELINEIVVDHLTDILFEALSESEQTVISALLMPYAEQDTDQNCSDEENMIFPATWLEEALDTLKPIKRSCKDSRQAAKLSNFVFATLVYEAFLAINFRGSITKEEVSLVNDVLQNHLTPEIYSLLPFAFRDELQKLMQPFTIDEGVDETPYLAVA